jgi:hypothetical protein
MDPPLQGDGYVAVSVDDDAEQMADELIADTLPRTFLNEIDLAAPGGLEELLVCLVLRHQQAAIEKDELVAFVQRNQAVLRRTSLLEMLSSQIEEADDEAFLRYLHDLVEQIRHVLAGRIDRVDLVSSRLLWLCVALHFKVDAGRMTHDEAVAVLRKDQHRQRIGPRAVLYMCKDYMDNRDTLSDPRIEYVMLLTECALLSGDAASLVFAFILLSDTPPPVDVNGWLRLVERAAAKLRAMGKLFPEGEQFLQRARTRFADHVADDDF